MQVSVNGLSEREYFNLSEFFMRNHVTTRNLHNIYRGKLGQIEQDFDIHFNIDNDARLSLQIRNEFLWIWVHEVDRQDVCIRIHKSDFENIRII